MPPIMGWVPNEEESKKYAARVGSLQKVASNLMGSGGNQDFHLWRPLLEVYKQKFGKDWKRMAQEIGSCVGWGHALVADMAMGIDHKLGVSSFRALACPSSIYGGARVEIANNGRPDRGGDGAYGAAAAEWLRKYGVVLRLDYRNITGSPDDDLRVPNGKKSKHYGMYGCGGKDDKGRLDKIAAQHPFQAVTQIRTNDEAIASISNGYPISICSMLGFGKMRRDQNGVVRRQGKWPHCMMIGGVRFFNGRPQFRVFNSWGASASGPDPGVDPRISHCSWWITEQDAHSIFSFGDSWAFGSLQGFAPRQLDFTAASKGID